MSGSELTCIVHAIDDLLDAEIVNLIGRKQRRETSIVRVLSRDGPLCLQVGCTASAQERLHALTRLHKVGEVLVEPIVSLSLVLVLTLLKEVVTGAPYALLHTVLFFLFLLDTVSQGLPDELSKLARCHAFLSKIDYRIFTSR